MKSLIFVFALVLNKAVEGLGDNCLKQNPLVLDGDANIYNKPENPFEVTVEEIASLITLITSRFKEAHILAGIEPWHMKQIAEGVSLFTNRTNKTVPLYLRMDGCGDDFNKTVLCMKEAIEAVTEINKNHKGMVSGLYLYSELKGYSEDLEALDLASFDDMNIPLGYYYDDCSALFMNEYAHNFTAKLHFISCYVPPILHSSPEDSSDEVIESCNQLRMTATSLNITAEIRCITEFYSEGRSGNFVVGSISSFERFWCRIVDHVLLNSQMKILMRSAFDTPPATYGKSNQELSYGKYHRGWWERLDLSSYEASAFNEKVNFLKKFEKQEAEAFIFTDHIVLISVLTAVMVILLILLAVWLWKTKNFIKSVRLTADDIKFFMHGQSSSEETQIEGLNAPYDQSYEIPKSAFEIDVGEGLGQGVHGAVYRGKLKETGAIVAIKTTHTNVSSTSTKQLLSEIKIMIHVGKNPNVLSLLAANTSDKKKGIIYLVLELCDLGSLEEILRNDQKLDEISDLLRTTGGTLATLMDKWALEIASGMEHIASKHVIHGDLAARNVLLTADGTAKITDFGLSRKLYAYTEYVKQNQEPLPWRWMAPESLRHMTFSTQSDVWAYGITLFEIYSRGKLPYPGLTWNLSLMDLLENGLINNQPENCDATRFSVMKACWNLVPSQRLKFSELKETFQDFGSKLYVNL